MRDVVITVPVLDRPKRALELARSVADATVVPYRLLFLCTKGDEAEIKACWEAAQVYPDTVEVIICPFPLAAGDFQRKTNFGIAGSSEPWILAGADDLRFHRGWDKIAIAMGESSRRRFVGTNDLRNAYVRKGIQSTHPLVHRSYVEECGTIDEPRKLYHEGYFHNWCDVEAAETAQMRDEWVFARRSHVEHLHPNWDRAIELDATYERGGLVGRREYDGVFVSDRELLQRRRPDPMPAVL
jgi:hypothetical protein